MSDCLFCQIVAGTIPAKKVHETNDVVAFDDISPAAPTHVLVIPKAHIQSAHDVTPANAAVFGEMVLAARAVAEARGLGPRGYRLVMNTGKDGGQSVFHAHMHVLGGRSLSWPPG